VVIGTDGDRNAEEMHHYEVLLTGQEGSHMPGAFVSKRYAEESRKTINGVVDKAEKIKLYFTGLWPEQHEKVCELGDKFLKMSAPLSWTEIVYKTYSICDEFKIPYWACLCGHSECEMDVHFEHLLGVSHLNEILQLLVNLVEDNKHCLATAEATKKAEEFSLTPSIAEIQQRQFDYLDCTKANGTFSRKEELKTLFDVTVATAIAFAEKVLKCGTEDCLKKLICEIPCDKHYEPVRDIFKKIMDRAKRRQINANRMLQYALNGDVDAVHKALPGNNEEWCITDAANLFVYLVRAAAERGDLDGNARLIPVSYEPSYSRGESAELLEKSYGRELPNIYFKFLENVDLFMTWAMDICALCDTDEMNYRGSECGASGYMDAIEELGKKATLVRIPDLSTSWGGFTFSLEVIFKYPPPLCTACRTKDATTRVALCGHLAYCKECAKQYGNHCAQNQKRECPICRKEGRAEDEHMFVKRARPC
jgi:hypothetical protein